jgi:HK97 gp10 family phage protein
MADLQYVKGLDALKASFNELPKVIGRRVLRPAVAAGALVIKTKAIELAPSLKKVDRHKNPRVRGMLKAAIYEKQVPEQSNDFVQTFYVGVRSGQRGKRYQYVVKTSAGDALLDAFYWKWLEFGHFYMPPRARNATTGKLVNQKWHRNNAKTTGSAVWVRPQPFMRPAFNLKKDEAIRAMVAYMAERIPKEARKLGIKTK